MGRPPFCAEAGRKLKTVAGGRVTTGQAQASTSKRRLPGSLTVPSPFPHAHTRRPKGPRETAVRKNTPLPQAYGQTRPLPSQHTHPFAVLDPRCCLVKTAHAPPSFPFPFVCVPVCPLPLVSGLSSHEKYIFTLIASPLFFCPSLLFPSSSKSSSNLFNFSYHYDFLVSRSHLLFTKQQHIHVSTELSQTLLYTNDLIQHSHDNNKEHSTTAHRIFTTHSRHHVRLVRLIQLHEQRRRDLLTHQHWQRPLFHSMRLSLVAQPRLPAVGLLLLFLFSV